jgi:hypothetical protein
VATAEVELWDERRKLAAIALFTMVTPTAVAAQYDHTVAAPPFQLTEFPNADVQSLRRARAAPVVTTLAINARFRSRGVLAHVENYRPSVDSTAATVSECTVPWSNLEHTGPEAACLAADASIGLPITVSTIPAENVGPNPDLTLRFTTAPATPIISAASAMLSVQHGTATVGIEVQAGDHQLAHGLATSLLLPSS